MVYKGSVQVKVGISEVPFSPLFSQCYGMTAMENALSRQKYRKAFSNLLKRDFKQVLLTYL